MKKYLLCFTVLVCFIFHNITAQTYHGDLTLTTQAEIDSFHYEEVVGDLTIQESEPGNITNLKGLRVLKKTTYIRYSDFGFFVGGDLIISSNIKLTSLDGLENLTKVGRSLNIRNNPSLLNIDSLSNITEIRWGIIINGNPLLENIDAFKGCNSFS